MRKLTGKNKKNILRPVHWVLTAGCSFLFLASEVNGSGSRIHGIYDRQGL